MDSGKLAELGIISLLVALIFFPGALFITIVLGIFFWKIVVFAGVLLFGAFYIANRRSVKIAKYEAEYEAYQREQRNELRNNYRNKYQ